MDMDISMDIHAKSVDMDIDMDVKFHIHGKPGEMRTATGLLLKTECLLFPARRSYVSAVLVIVILSGTRVLCDETKHILPIF